jgi:hypothetical protein
MFPPEMQVKQYVGQLRGAFGFTWTVFRTGSDRYYLFVCDQNTNMAVPVLKADLQPAVRSALAHGVGHDVSVQG